MTPPGPRFKRGDVVLVLFPNSDLRTAKLRPVVIVQADNLQTGLPQVIVAMITSALSPPMPDLPQRTLRRLQDDYVILGWDPDQGAEVELPDDLRLSMRCTQEEISIGVETKYRFQFEKRAKEFSARGFLDRLLRP
jgi:hypothetical protein